MSYRVRTLRRVLLATFLATTLTPTWFIGSRWAGGNRGVVEPGRIYRSAQLDGKALEGVIREAGIRTVVNLRGANPGQPWYPAERQAARRAGATLISLPMASDQWLSRAEARALLEVLDTCEYPILIHCQWGAERTGLVAAFATLLRPGGTLEGARGQFSAHYLFLPLGDGKVMLGHLERYAAWLRGRGEAHTPGRFRRWLGEVYVPGRPSREYWEINPYPLAEYATPRGEEWTLRAADDRRRGDPSGRQARAESPRGGPSRHDGEP